ncbi:TPA: phytanoyl-CoA dioxygenase family protein [Candidatus Poribacteria bacterium]|nr:phytanoyl-CoA dioxygenase family protein [Candidatus Poribacteria bacterium]HIB91275.1 phytanoyl-CoA dioxygenase family protein [Candidatus Poribacteria bacterium]HIC01371.1 phytanoyl-CoA dioxygenase family protein [Candidatus Poribacteria bacterium]HIN30298.1 phytanoyl-CoA dioxygenase family protein [Candidatus Poribacteria bacterium]
MTEISCDKRIDVPKSLSDNQVQFFIENGYIAVPNLIESDEIEELREDTVHIARGGYPCEAVQPVSENLSDDQILASILCIHQPHFISPVMKKYVKHPELCGVLSQITAAHIPFWDGSVKCMQSMLFVKPSGFQGQSWHQDEIYIPTRDRSLIGGWIAMDDATVENGCLWVIPGSHRMGYLYSQKPHDNPEEFDSADLESYGFDETLEVPVEVKAGTVVFFNGYLLHRSRKNRGQTYRRVLVNHYCNAWSLLPWSIKEGERPANADRRGVIPVSGVDPYAWKGYEATPKNVHFRHCKAVNDLKTQL